MIVKNFVEKDKYYDSVLLMRLAARLTEMDGIANVSVGMGTSLNKDTIHELGLLTDDGSAASPNDLVIAVSAESEPAASAARKQFLHLLLESGGKKTGRSYPTLDAMSRALHDRNLAVISLAGQYAGAEAEKALSLGMDVFMFSDNVPLEEEIELKETAHAKGLLMMGPDCGLSFIGGTAIGLCSKVRRGSIGIAAACGSGMQEVMNIVHKNGLGVSHAIGVGGRDLCLAVGGITMLDSIDLLDADPETSVIVLISKPPAAEVAEKILRRVKQCQKPVVVQFINSDPGLAAGSGAYISDCFENTAKMAMSLSQGKPIALESDEAYDKRLESLAKREAGQLAGAQRYLRGLYCGGSLAEETLTLAQKKLGPLYGNIAFDEAHRLIDSNISRGDCLIDMGAEEFTLGKPHVAIDPTLRIQRFAKEARDPETAVILMDMLLGYALCEDPAGRMEQPIRDAMAAAKAEDRHLCVITSLCGSDLDPQGLSAQEKILKDAGALVMQNNGEASRLAALIIAFRREALTRA